MAGALVELTDDNFDEEVLKADRPVLVDFWAPWCGPCRMIAPVIDELANEVGDRFKVCKLNTDNASNVPAKYDISGIPTLLVFKGGEVVQRFVGVTNKADLLKALEAA